MTIPDSWLSSSPASSTITSVRPNNDRTWSQPSELKPTVDIRLVSATEEATVVDRVQVDGNVAALTVSYKATEESEFISVLDMDGTAKVK